MKIKPIKTDQDLEEMLRIIESLMDAERGTPEGELLDILVILVETYENRHGSVSSLGKT